MIKPELWIPASRYSTASGARSGSSISLFVFRPPRCLLCLLTGLVHSETNGSSLPQSRRHSSGQKKATTFSTSLQLMAEQAHYTGAHRADTNGCPTYAYEAIGELPLSWYGLRLSGTSETFGGGSKCPPQGQRAIEGPDLYAFGCAMHLGLWTLSHAFHVIAVTL